jgi:hypothetical protein
VGIETVPCVLKSFFLVLNIQRVVRSMVCPLFTTPTDVYVCSAFIMTPKPLKCIVALAEFYAIRLERNAVLLMTSSFYVEQETERCVDIEC